MKRLLRSRFAGVVLSILLFGCLIVFIFVLETVGGVSKAMGCTNRMMEKLDSKEQTYTVYQFNRLCSATAPDTLQMSLQPFGSSFDNEKYPSFLVLDSRARAVGTWLGPQEFSVQLESVERTYQNEANAMEVNIQYVQ